jgi:hypothetical protein
MNIQPRHVFHNTTKTILWILQKISFWLVNFSIYFSFFCLVSSIILIHVYFYFFCIWKSNAIVYYLAFIDSLKIFILTNELVLILDFLYGFYYFCKCFETYYANWWFVPCPCQPLVFYVPLLCFTLLQRTIVDQMLLLHSSKWCLIILKFWKYPTCGSLLYIINQNFVKKCHMVLCDWFKMMWSSKNMMWKFNFNTQMSKLTPTYGNKKFIDEIF